MRRLRWIILSTLLLIVVTTYLQLQPIVQSFKSIVEENNYIRFVDRYGMPLNISYQLKWNTHDYLPFQRIPSFLVEAFIISEDKNFFAHHGTDLMAKFNAVENNFKAGKIVRGASTITEQVVRMLTNRKRTFWSKWLELWEASLLERTISKEQVLEFYLNQVPYASNRRGIAQVARFYFNREVDTLSKKEMLALLVLARAPSSYDLYNTSHEVVEKAINRLANQLVTNQLLSATDLKEIEEEPLILEPAKDTINAAHFIHYLRKSKTLPYGTTIKTTLDGRLQQFTQKILEQRVRALQYRNVHNAAAVVINHQTGEVLTYNTIATDIQHGSDINSLLVARQPGSTLKPFIYAMALEKGWDSLTIIEDEPLTDRVNDGLHSFRNYSNTYYGKMTLRQALGNSLNIPAVKAIRYVGVENFLDKLHELGMNNLTAEAFYYDEGLALGNGAVTLLNLAKAYGVLANQGMNMELKYFIPTYTREPPKQIFSREAVSVISNILSDPEARKIEFTANSVLNLPVQTAIKTGTSTDFRDAWAAGYNSKFLVVIWMGSLDQQPMQEVTGSTGPALALRSIFRELNKHNKLSPLPISDQLHIVNAEIELNDGKRIMASDYVLRKDFLRDSRESDGIYIMQPTYNLKLAIDPRIPQDRQAFNFKIQGMKATDKAIWNINGVNYEAAANYLWPLKKGQHSAFASIYNQQQELIYKSEVISFSVN